MEKIIIVSPEKGPPFNEAWTKEVKLTSDKLNIPVITTGEILFPFIKNKNYYIFRHSKILYPFFAIFVLFKCLSYKLVILECTPNSIYFRILIWIIGKKKIIYHFRDNDWKIKYEELKKFKAIISPFDKELGKKNINFRFGINVNEYTGNKVKKNNKFTFLFASAPLKHHKFPNIFDEKGIIILLKSFAKLDIKDKKLILLWRGAHYQKIIGIIKKEFSSLDIKVINKKVNVQDYYNKSDVIVLAARKKEHTPPYPSSLMEAIVFGKPVIASNIFPISDVINKEKLGVICLPNEKSLLNAMKEINKKYDHYRLNCIKKGKHLFDIEKSIKNLEKQLKSL